MEDCIFCKIVKGEIPSKKLYEDDKVYAFYDIEPAGPVHFLVIPKEHIESVNMLNEKNAEIVSHVFLVINKLVNELGISDKGYRIVNNTGEHGGQTVPHMHFHVIAGRNLAWPPG
ncbi:MAG: histidine triad nucleotide-binding protein [Clostridium sp.]|uniref:histidine triad nucleotide-binding protein n=1 Tax=Clostridium sp. DSM 8431 TaxID=1761781 RepID=UPI0008E190C0|nr:histidine triad nucleotide-binding protein [Clostridium sp. DSM 8431]MCR4943955.1 histidine triad nucleotide-binding protein [Clostridium sp.]SFU48366.1 histidine triad (HIT) family protein [Clostridium sp. DSM 8431]